MFELGFRELGFGFDQLGAGFLYPCLGCLEIRLGNVYPGNGLVPLGLEVSHINYHQAIARSDAIALPLQDDPRRLAAAVRRSEICFIAVGTPQASNGEADLAAVMKVAEGIAEGAEIQIESEAGQIVALVVAEEPGFKDYHWYRRDSNGMWSHKPGSTPARNTDNSGLLISSPETCDRRPYRIFCGYFHSIPARVRII